MSWDQFQSVNDYGLELARGKINGAFRINKFGRNIDVDAASSSETIWSFGGIWIAPQAPQIHNVLSSDVADTGALRSSGTATEESSETLIDSNADFITDGVLVGDVVLNDTLLLFGFVTAINSATELEVFRSNGALFNEGDAYRIAYATGIGAGVVQIENGLDADWMPQGEFVILNGLTPVPTVKSYNRIDRARTVNAGDPTAPLNVGAIDFDQSLPPFFTTAEIPPNSGQTQMAVYTTAANEEAYLMSYYASVNRTGNINQVADALISIGIIPAGFPTAAVNIINTIGVNQRGASPAYRPYETPQRIPPRTDIIMAVSNSAFDDTDVSAGFDLRCFIIPD